MALDEEDVIEIEQRIGQGDAAAQGGDVTEHAAQRHFGGGGFRLREPIREGVERGGVVGQIGCASHRPEVIEQRAAAAQDDVRRCEVGLMDEGLGTVDFAGKAFVVPVVTVGELALQLVELAFDGLGQQGVEVGDGSGRRRAGGRVFRTDRHQTNGRDEHDGKKFAPGMHLDEKYRVGRRFLSLCFRATAFPNHLCHATHYSITVPCRRRGEVASLATRQGLRPGAPPCSPPPFFPASVPADSGSRKCKIHRAHAVSIIFDPPMNPIATFAAVVLALSTFASSAAESDAARDARMAWWREARFGMFVVWGLYSGLAGDWNGKMVADKGGLEWIQKTVKADTYTYAAQAVPKFQPKPGFATAWARLAKQAGCQYVVFTTKHHDGFALHDSKLTQYDAGDILNRDLVREITDALHAEGLKVGFYHSVIDWHHPQYDFTQIQATPLPGRWRGNRRHAARPLAIYQLPPRPGR